MARANQTWGEEQIAAELLLKLGVAVSPRTVSRYMRRPVPCRPSSSAQTWSTFVQNHARETLACDFFVAVTSTFRLVYVFLVLEIGTRRIVHWNVTEYDCAPFFANLKMIGYNQRISVEASSKDIPGEGAQSIALLRHACEP